MSRRRLPDGHAVLSDVAGTRGRLAVDSRDNVWAIYTIDASETAADSAGLYFPRGKLVLSRATAASGWQDWQRTYVSDEPYVGEALDDPYRL